MKELRRRPPDHEELAALRAKPPAVKPTEPLVGGWPPPPPNTPGDYAVFVERCSDLLGHERHMWGPLLEDDNRHAWQQMCPGVKPKELPKITVVKLGRRKYGP